MVNLTLLYFVFFFSLCWMVFVCQRILIINKGHGEHSRASPNESGSKFVYIYCINDYCSSWTVKTVSCRSFNCAVIVTDARRGLSGAGG
jgi:hypothetical protein